jgi:uncharacterized membrane protein
MRAKYLSSIILTLLLMNFAAFAQGGGDSLMVQVREASGRPVKYACVTVIPKEGEILFRKADGKGRVRFKGVTKGSYRVVVKADGYVAQKREVNVERSAWTVDFSLQPRGGDQ